MMMMMMMMMNDDDDDDDDGDDDDDDDDDHDDVVHLSTTRKLDSQVVAIQRPKKKEPKWRHINWKYMSYHEADEFVLHIARIVWCSRKTRLTPKK